MSRVGQTLAALAACVALVQCGAEGAEVEARPEPVRVRALTYNVAGLPEGISGSSPATNTPLISPLLCAYDIALVQEDFTFHEDLISAVDHPHLSTHRPGRWRPVGDGLNRMARQPFVEHRRVKWVTCHGFASAASDCLSEKGFSVATHELAPGLFVDVYNLHADAGGGDGDIEAREKQFAQLAKFAKAHSEGRAVIVAGDFNLRFGRGRDRRVMEQLVADLGLRDAGAELAEERRHIDRFLYRSGGGVALEAKEWKVADQFVTDEGARLSDHPAIEVVFEVRAD